MKPSPTGSPLRIAIRASAAATSAAHATFEAGARRAAVAHRRRRIDDETQRAIGLGLELADEEVVVTEQRTHVEPAQVVAGRVCAVSAELDAGALARAAMRAGVDALGHHARADAQRREAAPVDRAAQARALARRQLCRRTAAGRSRLREPDLGDRAADLRARAAEELAGEGDLHRDRARES